MTPYVVHNNDEEAVQPPQKPKSIMVGAANGGLVSNGGGGTANGTAVSLPADEAVDSPDSLPSRSSVSGSRSIMGNGKNGRSGALKRVSFGSSKGSMVETLVYDHQEDLAEVPSFLTAAPVTNGEESRVHPAKVRVKFIESQPVAQVCAPPSPDVTLEFGSDTMTSPASEHSPDYQRQISHESGIDNPFRPDGELSREADTIVSLIQAGKPINLQDASSLVEEVMDEPIVQQHHQAALKAASNGVDHTDSGTTKGTNGVTTPGVVEVQRGVIAPPPSSEVEQVVIKKKPKCHCCTIQ